MLLMSFTGLVSLGKNGMYGRLEYSQSMPHFGKAYVGIPFEIDSTDGHYNRVVFHCGPLDFQVTKKTSTLEYMPILKDNTKLYTSAQEFDVDSIDFWTENNIPVFNLRIMDSDGLCKHIYWYPFTVAKYFDCRLNEFPITVVDVCKYNVKVSGDLIDVYVDSQNKISIKTPGIKRGLRDGVYYRDTYALADTIPLNNFFIKINSVDFINKEINYEIIPKSDDSIWISPLFLKKIGIADTKKEFYLIDFFGSWCTPCIRGLNDLINQKKELYDKYDVITVACEDNPSDFLKSKEILENIGVDWNIMYEVIGEGLNEKLHICNYPTYVIVDRNGLIHIISNEVKDILNHINN